MIRDQDISVILVDESDTVIGYGDKLDVHRKGLLHRAFSVFIYNDQGQLLLQRRADSKYHAAGLWANSCCGHPFPGEKVEDAAGRRLQEELGFTCALTPLTHIYYRKNLDQGMIEHEYVHVFEGSYNAPRIYFEPQEISEIQWISVPDLIQDVAENTDKYAAWFAHYVQDHADQIFKNRLST